MVVCKQQISNKNHMHMYVFHQNIIAKVAMDVQISDFGEKIMVVVRIRQGVATYRPFIEQYSSGGIITVAVDRTSLQTGGR